ncbi:MAG TPA: hypothetical protein HA306_00970 [Methanosarcina sp.]|nr:hypothetical protein [Methanosarcina sp.]
MLVGELMFICGLKCGLEGKRKFSQAKRRFLTIFCSAYESQKLKIKKNPESCRWKRKANKK